MLGEAQRLGGGGIPKYWPSLTVVAIRVILDWIVKGQRLTILLFASHCKTFSMKKSASKGLAYRLTYLNMRGYIGAAFMSAYLTAIGLSWSVMMKGWYRQSKLCTRFRRKFMEILRQLWHIWKRIGQAIGDLLARVVLTLFYFTILLPFGLGVRLFSDPLDIQENIEGALWLERTTNDLTVDDARRLS
jgi:hypothetical protein